MNFDKKKNFDEHEYNEIFFLFDEQKNLMNIDKHQKI